MQLFTLGDIARKFGVPNHRIKYLVERHRIPPTQRVGILRVWDPDAVEKVREFLASTGDRKRKGGVNGA